MSFSYIIAKHFTAKRFKRLSFFKHHVGTRFVCAWKWHYFWKMYSIFGIRFVISDQKTCSDIVEVKKCCIAKPFRFQSHGVWADNGYTSKYTTVMKIRRGAQSSSDCDIFFPKSIIIMRNCCRSVTYSRHYEYVWTKFAPSARIFKSFQMGFVRNFAFLITTSSITL